LTLFSWPVRDVARKKQTPKVVTPHHRRMTFVLLMGLLLHNLNGQAFALSLIRVVARPR
jgi:hypothetical protein